MADSTSRLDVIDSGQAQKEVTANDLFNAMSPAALFARRASTTFSLTWGFYGGRILVNGVLTSINNSTVALTNTATNFIEATYAGVVSSNTSAFTPGRIPLYSAVAAGGVVTSYTDERTWVDMFYSSQFLSKTWPSDATHILLAADMRVKVLRMTGGSLTATRNLQVPLAFGPMTFHNNTSGAQSIQVIGASGTGITVANAKHAMLYGDGTNVMRITNDSP